MASDRPLAVLLPAPKASKSPSRHRCPCPCASEAGTIRPDGAIAVSRSREASQVGRVATPASPKRKEPDTVLRSPPPALAGVRGRDPQIQNDAGPAKRQAGAHPPASRGSRTITAYASGPAPLMGAPRSKPRRPPLPALRSRFVSSDKDGGGLARGGPTTGPKRAALAPEAGPRKGPVASGGKN